MKYYSPRYLFRLFELRRVIRHGRAFLEIGPGNLNLCQELLQVFEFGTLVEYSPEVVEAYAALREKQQRRLRLIVADFLAYRGLNEKYDLVVACEVLEHVADDAAFVRKVRSRLRDNGQLVLSVPARQKYWSVDDEMVGHFRRYERAGIKQLLEQAGFCGVRIVSYGFPFQNLVRVARIALARVQFQTRSQWDQKRRSQKSGFPVRPRSFANAAGWLINKWTLLPFCIIASLFNRLDLGEGYIVTATTDGS